MLSDIKKTQQDHLYLFQRIDDKLSKLNALRPIPKSSLYKIKEKFSFEMTYNSNSIEGNSLTLKETYWVINEDLTIKGKPLKDHLEAQDHHEALDYLYELVEYQGRPTLSEHTIKSIHQIVMKKTDDDFAGKYRNTDVWIGGSDHKPPGASAVPGLMSDLMSWFRKNSKEHPISLATYFHHRMVNIHPFIDGNGRTARLVMNIILMKQGYPLAVILKNDRKKYYRSLELADKGSYDKLIKFIAQAVERSLDIYLKMLTPESDKKERFLKMSDIASETPYSAEYLSLLARRGKLEAHKEKRDWLTSMEAVERYVDSRERKERSIF